MIFRSWNGMYICVWMVVDCISGWWLKLELEIFSFMYSIHSSGFISNVIVPCRAVSWHFVSFKSHQTFAYGKWDFFLFFPFHVFFFSLSLWGILHRLNLIDSIRCRALRWTIYIYSICICCWRGFSIGFFFFVVQGLFFFKFFYRVFFFFINENKR